MKKIVHLTMSNKYGGAEKVIFNIISNLYKKYEFYYICPEGEIESELKKRQIKHYCFKTKNDIKKYLKNIKPDKIHAHDFTASCISAFYKSKETKIISHLHTDHSWLKNTTYKTLFYLLGNYFHEKIIFVSDFLFNNYKFKKIVKNKSIVLWNHIDNIEINNKSKEYDIKENYDLIFMGRLSEYKNPIKFINIIYLLKMNGYNIKALIIGDGELREKCAKEISKKNLEKVIELKGFLENPFPYLNKSKILIMPSLNEAYGLSALEANILCKPVIGEKIGGLIEVISDKGGILCESLDEYVINIKKLLDNNQLYERYSKLAHENSRQFTNVENYMKTIEEIYN